MPHRFLADYNTHQLLNKIRENILIANAAFEIVYINDCAKSLLQKIGPYVGIENPDAFIGQSLFRFHGDRQTEILRNGPFPHSAQITLFKTFTAQIVVDRLEGDNGVPIGFLLTWKDVTEYEAALKEGQELLAELDIPVIPMTLDNMILVPILGKLNGDRVARMENKVLAYCSEYDKESVLFDFTGVTSEFDPTIAYRLKLMVKSLHLMGVEPIYIGIRPDLAKAIVQNRIDLGVKTFQSYKQGIKYLWRKHGYHLVKIEE
ncbi:hypothetical protein D1B31_05410 [Neobacillus notoginsengisoli]|uniref:STAS domain-containing protein n=1 Tax=Neobacillus notoginsengisoli TaxID=1578198 RepID=A0A417YWZ6_9BACI|nr:hypothetical protein [Neobacillus notoginsengisoli]RHW42076.1 hypothetical protein D1B31_05410 [Neobacillus notoginsengisoli]